VGELPGLHRFEADLAALARQRNNVLFDFVEGSCIAFENGDSRMLLRHDLEEPRRSLGEALVTLRNDFIAENQDTMLEALMATDCIYGGRLSNSNGLSSAVVTSLIAAGRFGPLG
jgi:hypothetical protein